MTKAKRSTFQSKRQFSYQEKMLSQPRWLQSGAARRALPFLLWTRRDHDKSWTAKAISLTQSQPKNPKPQHQTLISNFRSGDFDLRNFCSDRFPIGEFSKWACALTVAGIPCIPADLATVDPCLPIRMNIVATPCGVGLDQSSTFSRFSSTSTWTKLSFSLQPLMREGHERCR